MRLLLLLLLPLAHLLPSRAWRERDVNLYNFLSHDYLLNTLLWLSVCLSLSYTECLGMAAMAIISNLGGPTYMDTKVWTFGEHGASVRHPDVLLHLDRSVNGPESEAGGWYWHSDGWGRAGSIGDGLWRDTIYWLLAQGKGQQIQSWYDPEDICLCYNVARDESESHSDE